MKRLLILSLLFLATPALAQTPNEFTIKVTPQEADVLWAGLRELPVKIAEPVMGKVRQQIMEQSQPKPAAKEEPKKE